MEDRRRKKGPLASPFEPDLGPHRDELPQAFVDQYLFSPQERVVLDGTMERVWRRGRWLWPLFWLAASSDLLFPETGAGVPVTVEIGATGSPPIHRWRRSFRFPNRTRRFTSRMEYDERLARVVEAIGPGGALAIAWEMRFEPPSTLHFDAAGWVLRIGPWRLRLPQWLLGSGRAVETADLSRPGAIRIDFAVSHPLLGDVFGYSGLFQVRGEPPAG